MAIHALEPEALDQAAEPDAVTQAPEPGLHAQTSELEPPSAPPPAVPEGEIELLGTLVVDRVAEIVELRQALADQAAIIAQLRAEVEAWRTRALSEAAARRLDAETARRHERELVSELHRRMIEIDVLTAELAWRRLRWWRRIGRQAPATPGSSLASAPR